MSLTKKEYGFALHILLLIFIKYDDQVNSWWIINCNFFIRNFYDKLKETRNSYLCDTPKNHWLELITEILSFLQIFNVRKTATFSIFQKLCQNINKKLYFWHILGLWKRIPDNSCGSNNCFFIFLVSSIPICLYYFLLLCFYFHLLFLFFSPRDTFYNLKCLLPPVRNIREIRNTS